jgi:hypothetical protein
MRSELVFNASHLTPNRYKLCSSVFLAVRKLHRDRESISESINTAMEFCSQDHSKDTETEPPSK